MAEAGLERRHMSPLLRLTIWFSSSRLGQQIYVRMIPPIDRRLMLWSKGKLSLSPRGDPNGVGGLALLSTIGAKTGKVRHMPLGFARDGEAIVILASNAARSHHPAWYRNLKKNPDVTITIAGGGQGRYRAEEVPPGPERDRLWRLLCVMNPGFEKYPERTGGRIMPVVHCRPAASLAGWPDR
jgi:deazaflavin-dependent oxidoreductase (nitroreductase family)